MRKNLEMFVAFAFLAAAGAAAPQVVSTPVPAPAQSATQPPQPPEKPILNLRLDELERRPVITFTPKDGGKKQDAAQSLPGLGGNPSKSWENAPPAVVPKSSEYY